MRKYWKRLQLQFLFLFFILLYSPAFSIRAELFNDSDWQCGTPELIKSEYILTPNSEWQFAKQTLELAKAQLANRSPNSVRPAPQSQVGDQLELYTHIPPGKIRAICKRVGKYAYVFVDNAVSNLVAEADLDNIINTFDNHTYPQVHAYLGTEWKPGIDMDARIILLLHDVGGNGSGTGYGGYFSPEDEIPNVSNSNHREIIYIDVYYPTQKRHALHSTIAHEFTHLMNWFQNGGSVDETWLEEAVPSFAEWKIYDYVHWIYVENFFNDPSTSLVSSNSEDISYGASFLFLLYLYEKYGGEKIIKEIVAQNMRGIAAINAALKKLGYNIRFSDVFNQWAIANLVNDTRQDSLYGYDSDNMAKYRIKPNVQIIERNYPVRRTGTINDWAATYVTFENLPPTLSITFDGESPGIFNAQVLRIDPLGNISSSTIELNAQNDGAYQANNLHADEQLILIFSSSLSGTYRYEAVANVVNIDVGEPIQVENGEDAPLILTLPVGSRIRQNSGDSRTPGEFGYEAIYLGNLHLSSSYTGIFIDLTPVPSPPGGEGRYAYVTGEWGLEIFDISQTSGVPRHIGEIPTPGTAENISVQNGYAYVAAGEAGMQIIDVRQPKNPLFLTSYRDGLTYVHKIQVIGDYAYLADLSEGLQILDISDLGNPHLVGNYKPKGKTFALHVSGQYAYTTDNEQGFQILDISDRKSPKLVGSADIAGYDIVTSDGYAYLAYGNLAILDIRNPIAPQIIAEDIQTPGQVVSVQWQNDYIYAADLEGGLAILDVSDVRNPRVIGRQNTAGQAFDVAIQGDYAYIADGYGGLQTIDISIPNHTQWVSQYDASGFAYAVDVYEEPALSKAKGYAYIADGEGGLRIVDVSDPSAATLKSQFRIPSSAYDVDVHDGYAYVAAGEAGLLVIDIRNSDAPPPSPLVHRGETVAQIQTPNLAWGITISENYAYLAADELWVVDISNPENPKTIAVHQIEGYAYKTRIAGNHAYVAALDGGIQILDITQPEKLNIIGHYDTGDIAKAIDISGNYAYIADSVSGMQIVDISNPQQPQFAGVYLTDAETVDVRVNRGYVYLLSRKSLEILSLQEPAKPELVEQFDNLNWAGGLNVSEKLIYVADGYDLKIFRFDSKAPWAVDDSALESSYTATKPILRYQLGQNYPNPFNPETWIPYQLAESGNVTISIYNLKGELIRTIKLGRKEAGSYLSKEKSAHWDGRNETGERVANGIYFYAMRANGFKATKKMVVR
jgi:hypothetical protein